MPQQLPLIVYQQAANTPSSRLRLCDLPAEERPLYRLRQHGSDALSTTELLALLLGSADGPGLAQELLSQYGSLHQLARTSKERLKQFRGIGEAQSARLMACLALSRRLQAPPAEEKTRVTSPADGANLLLPRLRHLEQEEVHVLLLDTRNYVIGTQCIYRGSLNSSTIRIGEIFRVALDATAAALILAHNHPSGDPSPSPEDIGVTRQIVEAGKLLSVEVLDHLIIGNGIFASLKEQGLGFD